MPTSPATVQELPPEAVVLKDQGNKALQQRRHKDAIELYSAALDAAPGSAVLLANRAEARLREEDWDAALADADAALSAVRGYAKAHFRRAAALAGLQRPAEATEAYGGALGLKGADDALLRRRIEEVSSAAWPVKTQRFSSMGQALVATKSIDAGNIVLSERPALVWDRMAPTDPRVAAAFTRHGLDINCAAAKAISTIGVKDLTQYQIELIRDLSVPEFDLVATPHIVSWINAARDIASEAPELFSSDPSSIARLLLSLQTNAVPDDTYGVFRVASKMSHSCSPTMVYQVVNGEPRFTAARPIGPGELVSFSYRGDGDFLQESNLRRQEVLRSHYLFTCRCTRCESDDRARGIRCDCGPSGLRVWRGAYPEPGAAPAVGTGWHCDECGRSFSADAMASALSVEKRLQERIAKFDVETKTDGYADLKAAVIEAESVLGTHHWVYGRLCKQLSTYFANMLRAGGGAAAAQLTLCFAAHHFDHLSSAGTWQHAVTLPASFATLTAKRIADTADAASTPMIPKAATGGVGSTVTINDAVKALVTFACPLLQTVYGETDNVAKDAASLASRFGVQPHGKAEPRDPAKILPAPPPLSTLFAMWEAEVVRIVKGASV